MAVRRGRAAHVHHQRQRAVRRHDEVEGHEPGGQVFGRVVRDAWDGAAFIDVQHAQAVRVGLDDKSAAAVGRKRDGDDRRTDVDLAAGLHPARQRPCAVDRQAGRLQTDLQRLQQGGRGGGKVAHMQLAARCRLPAGAVGAFRPGHGVGDQRQPLVWGHGQVDRRAEQ
ncbi:hypothetical protein G6F32_015312 [Rhizopus arrhizus]|nr:hypothetical protein G6F32_015312 [Rhizopus arrhizus]